MQCRSFDKGVEENNLGNSEYQTLKFNYRQFRRDSHVSDTSSFPTELRLSGEVGGAWRWRDLGPCRRDCCQCHPRVWRGCHPAWPLLSTLFRNSGKMSETGHGFRMRISYKWIHRAKTAPKWSSFVGAKEKLTGVVQTTWVLPPSLMSLTLMTPMMELSPCPPQCSGSKSGSKVRLSVSGGGQERPDPGSRSGVTWTDTRVSHRE